MDINKDSFEKILNDCKINQASFKEVLSNISKLKDIYTSNELNEIYNYILLNINVPEILIGVIKLADEVKSQATLSILVDILLLKHANIENVDEVITLRAQCAKAISNYKDNSTVGTLLYCLNNKNENYKVRLACADALGRIGDKYAVAPLIDILNDEEEKSVYVKESATFALGLLGDTSAIDPLVSIMEAKQNFIGKFSFLKEKIVEALGKLNINNKKVHGVLKNALMDSSPMVRINAIEALMNSDYEDAEPLIRTSLNDEEDEVKKNALIALYNMQGRDILDEVISLPSYSKFLKDEAQNLINEYEYEDYNE